MPRFTRQSWVFAAALGLGLAVGSGIVPAAAQMGGGTTISIRPLDPAEVAFPDIGPAATAAGSTSDEGGPRVTAGSGIHVVIDGNMFGGN